MKPQSTRRMCASKMDAWIAQLVNVKTQGFDLICWFREIEYNP